MADHDDEARLIDDILNGEASAYAVLVRRYQGPIYALMRRMCRDVEDARDLTQDAFVTAYEKLDRFRPGARFFPWLYAMSLNLARDHLRRRGRAEVTAAELPEGFFDQFGTVAPEDDLIDRIDAASLLTAMDHLGAQTREALLLRYREGLSTPDIAKALGVSSSGVKMRISRGLERLRGMFAAQTGGGSR